MEVKGNSENCHVAVFPFPFASHPILMFNLVNKLAFAAPNVQFSFFSTSKSNNFLLSRKNTNLPSNIRFYNLDDGSEYQGSDLFREMDSHIKAVPEKFQRGADVAENQTGRKITSFLADAFFSHVVGNMAEDRKVSWVGFFVLNPCALPAFLNMDHIRWVYYNLHSKPDNLEFNIVPGLPPISYWDLPVRDTIESGVVESATGSLVYSMSENIERAPAVILNSFQEHIPDAFVSYVKSKFQNVLFLDTLTFPESPDEDSSGCLTWLDGQKEGSVVYVSSGSAIPWSPEECRALAEALDAFGAPFLWSLKDELRTCLPLGFLDNANGKVVSWAPQSQVLKHPSISVLVGSGGNSSVLECIMGGVPIICSSVLADNHIGAKMVEEVWRIGVRVEGRKITKDGMMKSLKIVFEQEKGKEIKENVKNLNQVFLKAAGPNGVAARDFETLVHLVSKQ